ncbi:Acetylxylan esterase precursor [Novipirellula aureliae]|uniref:Acetylxylan esterase n=1 Tax=Novipirellula aureliae TaxID=2527966 RepID=A0A5C6DYY9_9BACT|nr:alpha/beta hydrolase [Novipirellula aureliae]TWU41655.1 Acetylxylan esterase precursor [Novipirellula aureliae]
MVRTEPSEPSASAKFDLGVADLARDTIGAAQAVRGLAISASANSKQPTHPISWLRALLMILQLPIRSLSPLVLCLLMTNLPTDLVTTAFADEPNTLTQPVWPLGVPGARFTQEGDNPQLYIRLAKSDSPTPMVVVFPGGGYSRHAMDHEGHEFAAWFESMGISSAICTYRLRGNGNGGEGYGHPAPMHDAQRAIQTLRARAKEFNVNPEQIGVIGFSAGGHLAATASTHFAQIRGDSEDPIARVSSRPDFSILCYGVLSMGTSYTHRGSQKNLLGTEPDPRLLASLNTPAQVTRDTPPTFLFHTAADKSVPVENSLQYYRACVEHGVSAEMHLFNEGGHGLGMAHSVAGTSQWPELCRAWLMRITEAND